MAERDPQDLADHLEQEADDLERHNRDLAQEWERKRADPGVPGAPPPASEDEEEPPTGAPTGKGGDED